MAKKLFALYIIALSAILFINIMPVKAYSDNVIYSLDYNSPKEKENCETLFGDPKKDGTFANFLQQIFTIIGYATPLLCFVLCVFDFVKATASQDKDALVKAIKRSLKRGILAIILFFLPLLINFLFPLLGWYGTCGIE